MTVPDEVRERLREKLWQLADEVSWLGLTDRDRSKYYRRWTDDPSIGEVLALYVDRGEVRVYIKDTLLKGYARQRQSDDAQARRVVGIADGTQVLQTYIKPHGRRYADGNMVCWGRANGWKLILMAAYERTYQRPDVKASAVILTNSVGRYSHIGTRTMIDDAASRLGIHRVVWITMTNVSPRQEDGSRQELALFQNSQLA